MCGLQSTQHKEPNQARLCKFSDALAVTVNTAQMQTKLLTAALMQLALKKRLMREVKERERLEKLAAKVSHCTAVHALSSSAYVAV